jgi:hypothetical protein
MFELPSPQVVDNKQVYEEIPPVLLSSFIPAPNQN